MVRLRPSLSSRLASTLVVSLVTLPSLSAHAAAVKVLDGTEPAAPPPTSAPPTPAAPPNAAEAPAAEAPAAEAPDAEAPAAEAPDAEAPATEPAPAAEPAPARESPEPAQEPPPPEGPAPAEDPLSADPFASPSEAATVGDADNADDASEDATDEDVSNRAEDDADASDQLSMPKHSIAYTNLTVLRLNPLGLENRLVMEYRYRLYDESSRLKDDSYISVGMDPIVSPAMARIGPSVFIKPLAILRLRASYGMLAHFGTFQFMQSYDTPTAEHFTAEYRATAEDRYASLGWQGQFGALLQAKVGPIAIRNDLNFYRTDINTKDNTGLFGEDPVFYYIRDDIMLAAHGWHLTNDTDLLYLSDFGLTAGIRNSVVKAFYPDDVFLPGESTDDPNGPTVRMGPLIAYTFFDRPEQNKRFNKPTLLIMSQWWIKHRYRTGAAKDYGESISLNAEGEKEPVGNLGDSLPAMPWFVLGFNFQGELFQAN